MKFKAIKCDICGELVRNYTHFKTKKAGVTLLGKQKYNYPIDICDSCMTEFRKFITNKVKEKKETENE